MKTLRYTAIVILAALGPTALPAGPNLMNLHRPRPVASTPAKAETPAPDKGCKTMIVRHGGRSNTQRAVACTEAIRDTVECRVHCSQR